VLVNAKEQNGEYLVKGRNVTGFANSEEEAVQLNDVVPHLVENTLIQRGGEYAKADDFAPFIQQDGNLITGQNPASSELVAERVLNQLQH